MASSRWRAFAVTFAAVAAAIFVGILGAALLVDPYDTGRFGIDYPKGVRTQGPRTANASRARDPAFQAAIFGNSHVQLLEPEGLTAATGIPFVSLMVPATRPKEQLTLIDWFLARRREPPRALVLGIDAPWCTPDPALLNEKPFPFWLYSLQPLDYIGGLVRYDLLEEIPRRIGFLLRGGKRARPDGYWNYEQNYIDLGYAEDAARRKLAAEQPAVVPNPIGQFPAADALALRLSRLPGETAVVLVRPPVFITALPKAGTPEAASDAACRDAFARVAAARPNTALVDWRDDRPDNRDPANFFDHTHYRMAVARKLQGDVAAAVRQLGASRDRQSPPNG